MLYTELTKKAMVICFEAHRDQVDKGGLPYSFHPFYLAERMETEEEVCAALLHDVIEETDWTYAQIAAQGFPSAVIEALQLLTRDDDDMPYLQYVERLSGNRIAAHVKLEDLRHNSMTGRLSVMGEKERKRMRKYLRAQAILTDGEPDLEEMTLCLQHEIRTSGNLAIREERGKEALHAESVPAVLTVVMASDGRVRRYSVTLPYEQREREFQELFPLLNFLEQHGYSAAHAVSCL